MLIGQTSHQCLCCVSAGGVAFALVVVFVPFTCSQLNELVKWTKMRKIYINKVAFGVSRFFGVLLVSCIQSAANVTIMGPVCCDCCALSARIQSSPKYLILLIQVHFWKSFHYAFSWTFFIGLNLMPTLPLTGSPGRRHIVYIYSFSR